MRFQTQVRIAATILLVGWWCSADGFAQSSQSCNPEDGGPDDICVYVSDRGEDSDDRGLSPRTPLKTFEQAIKRLRPGSTLYVMGPEYAHCPAWVRSGEQACITIENVHGKREKPITIKAWVPSPPLTVPARILGTLTHVGTETRLFHRIPRGSDGTPLPQGNDEWEPVSAADGGVPGEYRSKRPVNVYNLADPWVRAAFVDPIHGRFTRLATYDYIDDLRANNETLETRILLRGETPPAPGLSFNCRKDNNQVIIDCRWRRWTYAGPGVAFDPATRRIHVRLMNTHNAVAGLEDYDSRRPDGANPNQLGIMVSVDNARSVMSINKVEHVRFENLIISNGTVPVRIAHSSNVTFDHVTLQASNYGLQSANTPGSLPIKNNESLTISNSVIDGGIPPWLFRSDVKDGGDPANMRGGVLVMLHPTDTNTTIQQSEFRAGLDGFHVAGTNLIFESNHVVDLLDDVFFMDKLGDCCDYRGLYTGHIRSNVIQKAYSAFSYRGKAAGTGGRDTDWLVYGNLIDLRDRVRTTRPFKPVPSHTPSGKPYAFSNGQLYVSNELIEGEPAAIGEFSGAFFHNTIAVLAGHPCSAAPGTVSCNAAAGFRTTINTLSPKRMNAAEALRQFNNVFVRFVSPDVADAVDVAAIAYMPRDPDHQFASNGNLYFRFGKGTALFEARPSNPSSPLRFSCVADGGQAQSWTNSDWYRAVNGQFESKGFLCIDPRFVDAWGRDYRLRPDSPIRGAAVPLPDPLAQHLVCTSGCSVGAYQGMGNEKLQVGVDRRLQF